MTENSVNSSDINFYPSTEQSDFSSLLLALERKKVLTRESIAHILNPAHDVRLQKRNLHLAIKKGGPQAYGKYRDALRELKPIDLNSINQIMDVPSSCQVVRSSSLNSVGSGGSLISNESDKNEVTLNDQTMDNSDSRSSDAAISRTEQTLSSHTNDDPSSSRTTPSTDPPDPCSSSCKTVKPFCLPVYQQGLKSWVESAHVSPNESVNIGTAQGLAVHVKSSISSVSTFCYPMDSYPRGWALVVNNIEFHNEDFCRRTGSENDAKRLLSMLDQLYFKVKFYENLTRREMEEAVASFCEMRELHGINCVIIVFMSHGSDGVYDADTHIIGSDGIGYRTKDIVSKFSNSNSPVLVHIPKVFFFQACRGQLYDPGVPVGEEFFSERTELDGKAIKHVKRDIRIPTLSDVFIAYAVPPGRPANRDIYTGTWFIQEIIDVFCNYAHEHDLESLLKIVNNNIKHKASGIVKNFQVVSTETIGWSKKLYFNPGLIKGLKMETVSLDASEEENEGTDVVDALPCEKKEGKLSRKKSEESLSISTPGCFSSLKCTLQ